MKVTEEIDVKHVKDIVQMIEYWHEGDRFCGDGDIRKEGRLVHVYESDRSIFKVSAKGNLLSTEFKKK